MKQNYNTMYQLEQVGKTVTLFGWVAKKRNLGGLIFIDLRDRSGVIQLALKPEDQAYSIAESLHSEDVITATGTIIERASKNQNLVTGDIEVEVTSLTVLNRAQELPFEIKNDTTALEETRLMYRYLDLRRETLKHNLLMRHRITTSIRTYLNELNFVEVETPILCKSTPEGARDYLVPSRVNKGSFYALPQSPQLFKQLLMIGGMERYYQIARCFRDEDLRADRQPEFTQVDMEMSFVNEEEVRAMTEGLLQKVMKDTLGLEITVPFPTMRYSDAMNYYGSDKPDLRFGMKLRDMTSLFHQTTFSVFRNILDDHGVIKGIVVREVANSYSRKKIDGFTTYVKRYGASNLAWLKYQEQTFTGSIAKVLSEEEQAALVRDYRLQDGDMIFIIAGKPSMVNTALGELRLHIGKDLDLLDPNEYQFLWVVDFPLFEYSEEDGRYYACHHPFTAPKDDSVAHLLTDPGKCYAKAYDVVLNGYEVGGGSIRIHQQEVQQKMFEALGMTPEVIDEKFGYFVRAFGYGTPPHGGLALGLERLTMLICKTDNIKDVIAFPKTASASDLMSESPNLVDPKQLEELHIAVTK